MSEPLAQSQGPRNPAATENILLRRPAVTTFIALATFLIPFSIMPYISLNRRLSRLHQQVGQLAASTRSMQRNMQTLLGRDVALRSELDTARKELLHLHQESAHRQAQLVSSSAAVSQELMKHAKGRQQMRQAVFVDSAKCRIHTLVLGSG